MYCFFAIKPIKPAINYSNKVSDNHNTTLKKNSNESSNNNNNTSAQKAEIAKSQFHLQKAKSQFHSP